MSLWLTIFFVGLTAWYAFDGYRNGIYYGLVRITTLILILLLSGPLGAQFAWAFEKVDWIPLLVRPHVATMLVVAALLLIGSIVSNLVRRWTMRLPERPTPEQLRAVRRARFYGMVMGALVGGFLALLLFIILWNIGWVAEELHVRPHLGGEPPREAAEEGGAEPAPPAPVEPVSAKMIAIKEGIEQSPVGGLVKACNPVDHDDYALCRDVLELVKDPGLRTRFVQHQDIQKLLKHPRMKAVLEDEEIRKLVEKRDFRALLDNRKIFDLVHDKALVDEMRRADIRKIIQEIKAAQSRSMERRPR